MAKYFPRYGDIFISNHSDELYVVTKVSSSRIKDAHDSPIMYYLLGVSLKTGKQPYMHLANAEAPNKNWQFIHFVFWRRLHLAEAKFLKIEKFGNLAVPQSVDIEYGQRS